MNHPIEKVAVILGSLSALGLALGVSKAAVWPALGQSGSTGSE